MSMKVTTQFFYPGVLLIQLEGGLDSTTASRFEDAVLGLVEEEFPEIILNLEHFQFAETRVIFVLDKAYHKARSYGAHLTLVCTPLSKKNFGLARFSKSFKFAESDEEAMNQALKRVSTTA